MNWFALTVALIAVAGDPSEQDAGVTVAVPFDAPVLRPLGRIPLFSPEVLGEGTATIANGLEGAVVPLLLQVHPDTTLPYRRAVPMEVSTKSFVYRAFFAEQGQIRMVELPYPGNGVGLDWRSKTAVVYDCTNRRDSDVPSAFRDLGFRVVRVPCDRETAATGVTTHESSWHREDTSASRPADWGLPCSTVGILRAGCFAENQRP